MRAGGRRIQGAGGAYRAGGRRIRGLALACGRSGSFLEVTWQAARAHSRGSDRRGARLAAWWAAWWAACLVGALVERYACGERDGVRELRHTGRLTHATNVGLGICRARAGRGTRWRVYSRRRPNDLRLIMHAARSPERAAPPSLCLKSLSPSSHSQSTHAPCR